MRKRRTWRDPGERAGRNRAVALVNIRGPKGKPPTITVSTECAWPGVTVGLRFLDHT